MHVHKILLTLLSVKLEVMLQHLVSTMQFQGAATATPLSFSHPILFRLSSLVLSLSSNTITNIF